MDTVIKAKNLCKRYALGTRVPYHRLTDAISNAASAAMRLLAPSKSPGTGDEKSDDGFFWALKDINFEVTRGEVIGIIGRNGAGKSTLLKILSRITEPTSGDVWLHGRIGSLLEVGTGFHPELTGRENIFLNGAILGMKRDEVTSKFDEIVAFAEVEKFLESPVKHYSSGMYMRLAFAVAAHLEPEILLVDEVLAVGDAEFQKKCLGKINQISTQGRTIFFVSHNLAAVESLCTRAIHLDTGHIVRDGKPSDVIAGYMAAQKTTGGERKFDKPAAADRPRGAIKAVRLVYDGQITAVPAASKPIEFQVDFWNDENNVPRSASIQLLDARSVIVFSVISVNTQFRTQSNLDSNNLSTGLFRFTCTVPGSLLNVGTYSIHVRIMGTSVSDVIQFVPDALTFTVNDSSYAKEIGFYGDLPGVIRPRLEWGLHNLDALD